ncbi:MAG: sugar transferase [Patescibacteria group bacterium]
MIGRQVRLEAIILFFGDLLAFSLAIPLTLLVRFFEWPSGELLLAHLGPFSLIFFVWLLVFFIAELYNPRPSLSRERLANTVVNAQLLNSLIALAFFYFVSYFTVTPKITLFVDLIFSLLLIVWWRLSVVNVLYRGRTDHYLFLCDGPEVAELKRVLTTNGRYHISVVDKLIPPEEWARQKIAVVVINPYDRSRPEIGASFYQSLFGGVQFVNIHELYEDIFGRVPISVIDERWLVQYVVADVWPIYRFLKRLMDLIIAGVLFLVTLILYPFIIATIKWEDRGPIFYNEERVGRLGKIFLIRKFRSMTTEGKLEERRVTRVGAFLRRTRLDELPQLTSVMAGRQSLIGPRPERPAYVKIYEHEIPYYHARHLIQPGLSGWAQIYQERHPHFRPEAAATREKLSYDLYYVKNRSFWLDLKIALKTVRTLLSQTGL